MSWLNNEYNSSWMKHVQKYAKKHKIDNMKIALKSAAPSYCVTVKRRELCKQHSSKKDCESYREECVWSDKCKGRTRKRSSRKRKRRSSKKKHSRNKLEKSESVLEFIGLSGGAGSEYLKQTSTKYRERPSPSFKATPYCGLTKKGNDGQWYFSKPMSKGCKWVKVAPVETPKRKASPPSPKRKSASSPKRKNVKPSSTKKTTVTKKKVIKKSPPKKVQSEEVYKIEYIMPDNWYEKTFFRAKSAIDAQDTLFSIFDVYKKAHGMASFT